MIPWLLPDKLLQAGKFPPHRVLLVEDDAAAVEAARIDCRSLHLELVVVGSKEEALEVLRQDRRLCLLMVDLGIPPTPDMDPHHSVGLLLISEVRGMGLTGDRLPILAMTALGEDHSLCQLAQDMGSSAFFKKAPGALLASRLRPLLQATCEHSHPAGCPNLGQGPPPRARSYSSDAKLYLLGEPGEDGYAVLVDGRRIELKEQAFELLVKLWRFDRTATGDGFVKPEALLPGRSSTTANRAIQRLVNALKAQGVELVESVDGVGRRIATPHVDWATANFEGRFKWLLEWRPPDPTAPRDTKPTSRRRRS